LREGRRFSNIVHKYTIVYYMNIMQYTIGNMLHLIYYAKLSHDRLMLHAIYTIGNSA
jgi:hypothetical protein